MPYLDLYYLDMRTKDKSLRVTGFSDSLFELIQDFRDFVKEYKLNKENLWYAEVSTYDDELLFSIDVDKAGVIILTPATQKEKHMNKLGKLIRHWRMRR